MSETGDVLQDLKTNLYNEKLEVNKSIYSIEVQIDELKKDINDLSRKTDSDFSLFSPRAVAKDFKGEIEGKEKEIEKLEEDLRAWYKKLSTVTKQIDSLKEVKIEPLNPGGEEIDTSSDKEEQDEKEDRFISTIASVRKGLVSLEKNNNYALKYLESNPGKARQYLEKNAELIKNMRFGTENY